MLDLTLLSKNIIDKSINDIYQKEYIFLKERNNIKNENINEYYRAIYIATFDVGKNYSTQLSFSSAGNDFLTYEENDKPIVSYIDDTDYTYESNHPYYATEVTSIFEKENLSYLSGMLITSIYLISDKSNNIYGYAVEIGHSEKINFLIENHSKSSGAHFSEKCFNIRLDLPQDRFYVKL